ncbi:hypothetical protein [Amycolatopsis samaneae]|uniref:ESX-1 secretion-associated protein n=1 Tax=Amycolatopsis samaneae TaxID=664691 RepID=A0ABW5GG87_9PSEU
MIGFETDLQDLRDASKDLGAAADAASAAATALAGHDVPTSSGTGGILDVAGLLPTYNAFGRTLGMPAVAKAYNEHLRLIEDLVKRLHETTLDTSHALRTVADLYEKADQDAKTRVHRAAAQLDEN